MREPLPIMIAVALLAAVAASGCSSGETPGARIWHRRCAACHGPDGSGRTRFAEGRPLADLTDGRWRHGPSRDAIRRLVAEGDPASTMPPFSGTLAPAEIDAVVDHVLRLAPATGQRTGTR